MAVLPVVRGAASNKSAKSTTLAVKWPEGVKKGDYALLYVTLRNEAAVTVETPAGWELVGSIEVGAAAAKRKVYLFVREITTEGAPETTLKASLGPTDFYATAVVIETGTYNKGAPFNAKGAWAEAAVATSKVKFQSVTTTVKECLAIACVEDNAAVTGVPPAGWTEVITFASFEPVLCKKAITNAEATGEPTVTTTANAAVITVAIAPGVLEQTLSTTQGQSSVVAKTVEAVKKVVTALTATVGKALTRVLPLVAQGQAATISGHTTHQGEVAQEQHATLKREIVRSPFTLEQGQGASHKAAQAKALAALQEVRPSTIAATPANLSTQQEQFVGMGRIGEHVRAVGQSQVAKRSITALTRTIKAGQSSTAVVVRIIPKVLSIIQGIVAVGGRTTLRELLAGQSSVASLGKVQQYRIYAEVVPPQRFWIDNL